jgi:hypothetical protein
MPQSLSDTHIRSDSADRLSCPPFQMITSKVAKFFSSFLLGILVTDYKQLFACPYNFN